MSDDVQPPAPQGAPVPIPMQVELPQDLVVAAAARLGREPQVVMEVMAGFLASLVSRGLGLSVGRAQPQPGIAIARSMPPTSPAHPLRVVP